MQSAVLLLCALPLLGCIMTADAAPAAAAPNVMAADEKYPNISQALQLISGTNAELTAYLSNPKTVCTFFAPTNKAMTDSMRDLGKYVGLASQNETLQNTTFNYHVIPGKALTTADLMKIINETDTRAGEPLWIHHQRGKPLIYHRPDYPVPLQQTNIKAGNCIVHTIDVAMIPPSATPMLNKWLVELDNLPPPAPRADWGEIITPLHAELAAEQEKRMAASWTSTATAAAAGVSGKDAAVPAAVATAASSAGAAVAVASSMPLAVAAALLLV